MPLAAAHAAFVLTGTLTTLLGPILPVVSASWSLDDTAAGALFAAQFAGSIAGTAVSGALVQRAGFSAAVTLGLALMSAGTGGLPLAAWPGALLLVGSYGVGLGITIPATNLYVAESAPGPRSAALNILNLAWAAGAVVSPPVFAWMAARGRTDLFFFGLSAALVAAAIACAASMRARVEGAASLQPPPRGARGAATQPVYWRSTAFIAFAVLFFVYVGTENALAGWVAVYAHRVESSAASLSMSTLFWGALMLGRAVAPYSLRHASETALILCWLLLAAIGTVLLLRAADLAAIAFSTALCGFGLAAVFPTTIAQLSREFGGASARAAAIAFVFAGLGGAVVPWLVGAWSTATGSLRTGLLVPLAGCLVMLALHAWRPKVRA